MRRLTSRSVTQLCSRNVILDSNGLKKLGLVSTFRKPQLATLATWSNFGGSAKMCISLRLWWTRGDSNPRPPRCERGALPAELLAHRFSLANDYTSMSYGQQIGTIRLPTFLPLPCVSRAKNACSAASSARCCDRLQAG